MPGPQCQSCGLLLGIENYGTNASGTQNFEYCNMCFQKGSFTDPDLTLPQMIQLSANYIVNMFHEEPEKARTQAEQTIPTLKRWRNTSI